MAKFCSNCGKELPENANACPSCGAAVRAEAAQGAAQSAAQPIIVNVENSNVNNNTAPAIAAHEKNKWIALLLLWFFGVLGAHKFYEGKIGMGILYLFTLGLCGIGCFIDFWVLLFKPTHYYV